MSRPGPCGRLRRKEVVALATASHPVSDAPSEGRQRRLRLVVPTMWTSLAISVIWIVVLVDALFGPDIVSSSPASFARVPSAIVLAFFAWLATWVIARHGFGQRGNG